MSTHNLCFEQKYEKYQISCLKIFLFFLVVKFSIYLNMHVFVMCIYMYFQLYSYQCSRQDSYICKSMSRDFFQNLARSLHCRYFLYE